jgi:orotate phosphoribosyltransferase
LRLAGANVKGMAAIFTYGFAVSEENFKNIILISFVSNYQNLLNLAVAKRYISEEEEQTKRME